jgi:tetratricopeptide (TPR) repeat protein
LGYRPPDEFETILEWVSGYRPPPENVRGWDNLGNALQRLGRIAECLPAYQKSIVLEPTWSAYSNLGNAYFMLKRYGEAITAFEKATELGPNQELAMGNLADAYRASGQKDKAMATYDKAIALAFQDLQVNPQNTGAMEDLALYYAKKGDSKHGMEFIQRARGIDKKDVGLIYVQATVENLAGKQSEALRTLSPFEFESDFHRYLEGRLSVPPNRAANAGNLKPVEIANGLRCLLQCVAHGLLYTFVGYSYHFDNLVSLLRHDSILRRATDVQEPEPKLL